MAKNTNKHKTINITLLKVNKDFLESPQRLPFNGNVVTDKSFAFSFACFDRTHELFNLGDNTPDSVVSGKWFIELLDCLKNVNNKSWSELFGGIYDQHPIDWNKTNTKAPDEDLQREYWQFRLNKSKGRVIGFYVRNPNVFYIVWLDPHHNLTNSEGYGKAVYYKSAMSLYEEKEKEILAAYREIKSLKEELAIAMEIIDGN